MKKLMFGIVIGIGICLSINAIRPSKEQLTFAYFDYPYYISDRIKKDVDFNFKKGFKVVSITNFTGNHSAIVIMER